MERDIVYKNLASNIKNLSSVEVNEISLIIAIIKKNIQDLINKNMEFLNKEFLDKSEYYGTKKIDLSKYRDQIIKGYENEFNRISLKLEEEYMNFALMLQETQSNQKISIANLKNVLESKQKYVESNEYDEFMTNIENLEKQRDDAETKIEFDKIDNYLNNISDPIEIYNKKIDIFANRYVKYCGLEEVYLSKLKKCNERIESAINSVMKYDVGALTIINKKSIFTIFSKLLSKISGVKKFEKEYVFKKLESLEKIKNDTDNMLSEIDNELDTNLISLELYKSNITQTYNPAV